MKKQPTSLRMNWGAGVLLLASACVATDSSELGEDLPLEVDTASEALTGTVAAAAADTRVRGASPNANDGKGTALVVTPLTVAAGSQQASVVRFNTADITSALGTNKLYSAKVELTISSIPLGWGGGRVALHRMNRAWTEGAGTVANAVGSTWACAKDTNTGNTTLDCASTDAWSWTTSTAFPFASTLTGTSRLYSNLGAVKVAIDVTADVQAFLNGTANNGWALRGTSDSRSGSSVTFGSRESSTPPRLLLEYGPDLCTVDAKKTTPGQCGCAAPDTDSDGDGIANCLEPTLLPVADTTIRLLNQYANDGTSPKLGVTAASIAGLERSLIRFDQTQIANAVSAGGGQLFDATVELTIADMAADWLGGRIDLAAMTKPWVEGNGTDTVLGANGATWRCAKDTNTASGNQTNDCASADVWGMTPLDLTPMPFASTPTAQAVIYSKKTTKVRFNVTADVKKFLAGTATNYGWMIKGPEGVLDANWLNFASRESATPPTLLLNVGKACPMTDPVTDERTQLRYLQCLDPNQTMGDCNLRLQAKANSDRQAASQRYVAKTFGTAEHLALVRDRNAKLKALTADAAKARAVCDGDSDGDMVADSVDQCPDTRQLRPTDDVGCEITTLPAAPPRAAVDAVLGTMGVVYDPRCKDFPVPEAVEFGPEPVEVHTSNPGYYRIIIPSYVTPEKGSCELEFQFRANVVRANGTQVFTTLSYSTQDDPRVRYQEPYFGWTMMFAVDANAGGEAALWSTDAKSVGLSARVVNGNGEASSWSPVRWFPIKVYN